jgi:dTDP-4-dehydrorhamnose 3,5-epimerase
LTFEPLDVSGAWVCRLVRHDDDRGSLAEWFSAADLAAATGQRLAPVQANHSVSRRGALRGIHYTDVPPGQAKYVYCVTGAVLDVVVDLRLGSDTFGQHCQVRLDAAEPSALYLSPGLGHAFCSLADGTAVSYLCSTAYNPGAERTISPLDPELAITWPFAVAELQLSPKDQGAPSLAAVRAEGLLPSLADCP